MSGMTPPGPPPPPPMQPPPQQATGFVALTLQGSILTSNMMGPKVRVNGYPVVTKYGENMIPVYAGANHLDVDMQWLRTYGQAAIDLQVPANAVVPVWYAAPLHQFARGRIGFQKQKRPGAALFWSIIAVFAILAGLLTAVAISNG